MFRLLCLCAVIVAGYVTNASAADATTVEAIREHVKAAVGTTPTTSLTVVTFETNGARGRRTSYRVGNDTRIVTELGPFTTQRGEFAKQAWHQNENGETVLDQPDPGAAVAEIRTTTATPIATPVVGFLIATRDGAGGGSNEYIEAATWRVVRRDSVAPTGTTTYAYDDFRTVDGFTQPWHWTVRDGHAIDDAEYRVERFSAGARPNDVAIASPRGTFVEFPAGTDRVALPVRKDRDRFFVRLNVGGRGLDFMLDSGAAGIIIDDDVARSLGLTVYNRYSNAANAGRFTSGRVLVPNVTIGALKMHDVAMSISPHSDAADRDGEVRGVGLLGFDFIGALALELDYEHGAVTAIDPNAFKPPTTPHTLALDIRLASETPMTDVTINGAVGERFLIDSGASSPVMIFDYFRRRYPRALVDLGGGEFRNRRYSGVGGGFETKPYQLDTVKLGTASFKDFLAFVVTTKTAYAYGGDGLIGTEFLRLFNVYFDYADSRIYLEPNDLGRAASGR